LDGTEDEREPGSAGALEFSEKKDDSSLILLEDAERAEDV
jgi:hypothetical protein